VSAMELDHLATLGTELDTFRGCLDGDLSVPVEHCAGWTLRDVAEHLGRENLWAAAAVVERHGGYEAPPAPTDIAPWFADTARVLTDALSVDPTTPAWTFAPPATVAFWRRRRCLETLVHRWDAQRALGISAQLEPELCGDGIAEVLEMFVPRQVRLGRAAELQAAVRFRATDLDCSWVLGPGEPVATLSGSAEQLMLALWNRVPWSELDGDFGTARAVLPGPLVP
ncbi:maleylpyruvate isomerase family mycothiol-dependent enzyme, partial [Micromonosporaceae bacterium Da 78-11]